jgi:hypothetical protein
MLYREFSRLFCLVLALSCCPPLRAAAQVTSPSFVAGLPEDEAAIREVLAGSSEEDRADDIDWENAFGARFNRRDKLDAFMSKRLAPTLAGATRTPLEIKIRFIGPTLCRRRCVFPNGWTGRARYRKYPSGSLDPNH